MTMKKTLFFAAICLFAGQHLSAQTSIELYENAMKFKAKENFTEAGKLMSKALAEDPQNIDYKKEFADIQYSRRLYFDAIPVYEELLANDDKNLIYLARLSEMYSMSPKKMKGVEYAEKALNLNPTDGEINKMLARTYLEVGHYPQAVRLYLRAEKALPNDRDLPFKIANCFEKMNKYNESMNYYIKALNLDPENPTKIYEAALSCYNANQYVKAVEFYQSAEDKGYLKTKFFYENWAMTYLEMKDYDKALFYYAKAKDYAPYDKDLNISIAEVYMKKGDFNKARNILDEILEINPEDAEVIYTKGMTYYKAGNTSKAEAYFNQAFALDPSLRSLRYTKTNF